MTDVLGLKPSVEKLISALHQKTFIVRLLWNTEGHVTHFLFLHKKSLKYYEKFHTVVQIDCTYKTEVKQLPLLAIVGITPTFMTYHVGFYYMKSETTVDYTWILSQLRSICSVIPEEFVLDQEQALRKSLTDIYAESHQVLCLWHIWQNIQRHCQKRFGSNSEFNYFINRFLRMVNEPNEDQHNTTYEEFLNEFSNVPDVLQYVKNEWMTRRESFIKCFCMVENSCFFKTGTFIEIKKTL
ncbi:hypothetical protein P9112_002205 [Eukaryota sp. TZLM1-RC]